MPKDDHFKMLAYVSAHARQAADAGEVVALTMDNWRELAQSHAETPVAEKLRKILEYVARRTIAGEWFYIENVARLAAVADMRDDAELKFVLKHLNDKDLITYGPMPPPERRRRADASYEKLEDAIQLTVDGWEAVAPVIGGMVGASFVAMSFDKRLDSAFSVGIEPAIKGCGLNVIRLDRVEHAENINDRLIADIRRCQFMVADFTFHPAGVYFEAGFALGLGRLVVWTCRKDDFTEKVHFDTRPYNHVLWESETELREKLTNRIRALVPNAKMA